MDLTIVYCKKGNFVEKSIGEEKVLVPLCNNVADMNKVFNLNEVGSFIYDSIDGEKSVEDVVNKLQCTYEVSRETVLSDVKDFITDMVSKGVLFAKHR